MAMVLRTQIDLKNDSWPQLLKKYKLDTVMSVARIQALWRRIRACSSPAVWYDLPDGGTVMAAATLGPGLDGLQEEWVSHGQLLDVYASDCLAMEALQCLYHVLEAELQKQGFFISRYTFVDAGLRQILELLSPDIRMTEEGMMQPLKSVAFRGILTGDAKEKCSVICEDCSHIDCPHRQSLHMENYREPGVIKYSYGYQRIFGE